jgi:hypothetical protein
MRFWGLTSFCNNLGRRSAGCEIDTKEKQIRGSLHCAVHDETVNGFGRDDYVFLWGERVVTAETRQQQIPFRMKTRKANATARNAMWQPERQCDNKKGSATTSKAVQLREGNANATTTKLSAGVD